MAATLRPHRGKKSTATTKELVLKRGEIFFEVPETGVGTGTGKIKMGDGTTPYGELPYYTSTDLSDLTGELANGVTATTQAAGDNSKKVATTAYVDTAVDNLPSPMIFKGSLGTGGTITTLPTAAASNEGWTYKVITAGTYASQAADVGDVFISNGTDWILIPSGDEPSGTLTSVKIETTGPIAIDDDSAITTSGVRVISHENSGVTAGTYKSVTVNATGHITAGTNPTTLAGYGITDAVPNSTTVNGHALSEDVTVTASDVGLGNVGNFKAVSTVASQGLSSTEQSNARANIGAGTSSFSGNFTDLNDKPTTLDGYGITDAVPDTRTVNGHALSENVTVTASDVGLGNVGNFKAVSTVASQGLTDTEKANARTNIGAGTSSFSGDFDDLTNTPTTLDGYGITDAMAKANPTGTGALSLNRKADTTVGANSVAVGYDTTAAGENSFAEGNSTLAGAPYAHAEGSQTQAVAPGAHAEGGSTQANSNYAHAEGQSTQALGTAAHAEGYNTKAYTTYNHAEGYGTEARGSAAHTEGTYTNTYSEAAHAEGYYTNARSNYSHAEGQSTETQGTAAHAEGYNTKAYGQRSHAEGNSTETTSSGNDGHAEGGYTKVKANYGHAEGYYSEAQAEESHAEGNYTIASGTASHAEGDNSKATAYASHAEGYNATASGNNSHAEGNYTTASGYAAHAEGNGSTASGDYSHAEGDNTIAASAAQHVQGRYNVSDSNDKYAFIIGNGYYDSEAPEGEQEVRSNAMTVDWDGNIVANNIPEVPTSDEGVYSLQASVSVVDDETTVLYTWGNSGEFTGELADGVTATTQMQGDGSNKVATTAYVDTAVDNLPSPMIFKGSLGTGGTITTLPAASTSNEGWTYKVITAGTYASQAADVGDVFISNGTSWILIPSGDEPSGTVTSVKIEATGPIAIDDDSAITSSGVRTISHANSGVTAGTYRSVTVNATGHITAGTNPTTLAGYGITDAVPNSTTVNGHALSENVTVTASDVGLGNVGNFKAVSTVASQGLTDTEKANARTNIGAGTSSFSGDFTDLTNTPTTLAGYGITDAVPNTRTVNGHALSENVTVTASDVGLGNVGNFKAVSTVASQGLSSTEQSNARANIGAMSNVDATGSGSLSWTGNATFTGAITASNIPAAPADDGTYLLMVAIVNGEPTYSWINFSTT